MVLYVKLSLSNTQGVSTFVSMIGTTTINEAEVKKAVEECNRRLRELAKECPNIQIKVSTPPHPKFKGDPSHDFLSVWAFDKKTTEQVF